MSKVIDEDPKSHEFNGLDTSEMILARILQIMDSQERKLESIERLLKGIAART